MNLASLLLVVGMLSLASFAQGLTGFGFGLIAMALLPLALSDITEIQAIVNVTSLAACAWMTVVTVRHVEWGHVRALLCGTMIGVCIGFMVVASLPAAVVTRLLGAALCAMVLFEMLVVRRRTAIHLPRSASVPIGLVSGVLTGAYNIGGPPLVVYIYGQPWSKEQHVATLTAVFLSSGLVRFSLLLWHHDLSRDVWIVSAWTIVPMLGAILLGTRLLKYVPQKNLRVLVFVGLFALGMKYLVTA